MHITKFGHCCLLVEVGKLRILTDPGNYTTQQNNLTDIDVVLITHQHADHFHVESVHEIVKNNPKVRIITNTAVGKLLQDINLMYEIVEDGQQIKIDGIAIEGAGREHAEIYDPVLPRVQNTGYFINEMFFYPGDAFYNPNKKVKILALPVAGPWCKIKEVIEYGLLVSPEVVFPVHDGGLKNTAFLLRIIEPAFKPKNIRFVPIPQDVRSMF